MFRYIPCFILCTTLFLTACDTEVQNESKIVGRWEYERVLMNGEEQSVQELGNPSLIINQDGTYFIDFGQVKEEGTWRLEDDTIYVKAEGQPEQEALLVRKITDETLEVVALDATDIDDDVTLEFFLRAVPEEK